MCLANQLALLLRPDSIDLLFLRSSCPLIIKINQKKNRETKYNFWKIDNLKKNLAFSCNVLAVPPFILICIPLDIWNKFGKDLIKDRYNYFSKLCYNPQTILFDSETFFCTILYLKCVMRFIVHLANEMCHNTVLLLNLTIFLISLYSLTMKMC